MLCGPGTMDNVQSQAKSYGSQLSEIARGFADGINHGIVSSLFLWYDSPVEIMNLAHSFIWARMAPYLAPVLMLFPLRQYNAVILFESGGLLHDQ